MTPRVGEVWAADLRGRVPWATNFSERVVGPVRITWASSDGRVFEGLALRPKALPARVTLARCNLVERTETA